MEEVGDKIVEWVEEQSVERQEILAGFLDLCDTLCNRVFTYGVHASGIIISDTDLPEIAPCRFAGSPTQRIPVTQFPMDEIEALQLVKFDALGLRTLDVLADWKGQMQKEGIDIEWSGLEHEEQNPEMWEMLSQGLTAGIFQVESGYAKKLAKGFKPQSVSDLSAIVALNRPGPIRSGAPESFIKRRAGEEEVTFDHPYLEDILSKTYGFFLYQEAVIRFFTKLGYSESDADAVRKILGKKQPEKWLDLFHGRDEWEGKGYIEVAASRGLGDLSQTKAAGWDGQDIENLYPNLDNPAWTIWSKIVSFAKYSFNLAHSVAYGTVGFRTTFAKYYGPYQYYISCIRNVDKNKKAEQMSEFIGEARRFGIAVRPPDIQYSQDLVTSYNNDILFGFSDVKNVGKDAAKYLVELRESGDVDVTTPETLSDSLAELSNEFNKEKANRKAAGLEVQAGQSPKMRLKANQIAALFTAGAWDRLGERDESLQAIQKCEREMLDVVLTDNTVEVFQNNTDKTSDCDTYEDALRPYEEDVRYYLPGIVYNIRPTVVKASGEPMGIVTIEYNGASLEFAVFPKSWQKYQWLFKERTPGVFKIKHSMSRSGRAGYHFEEGQKLS
jgi:DNA polymerase-3 subunit alpha